MDKIKINTSLLILLLLLIHKVSVGQFINGEKDVLLPIQKMADSLLINHTKSISPSEVKLFLDEKSKEISSNIISLTKANNKELSANELYKSNKDGVGFVGMCSKPSPNRPIFVNPASAFAITSDGICFTNYHVLYAYTFSLGYDSLGVFLVRLGNGKIYPLKRILATSIENDIAVIQLDLNKNEKVPYLTIENDLPEIGDPIYVLGNPEGLYYNLSSGIVSSFYSDNLMWPNGRGGSIRNLMAITADFAVGASGSPILNNKGNVVGMVSSTHIIEQKSNRTPLTQMVVKNAIPLSSLKEILKSININ